MFWLFYIAIFRLRTKKGFNIQPSLWKYEISLTEIFGSEPEDGYMKKAETCRCYNCLYFNSYLQIKDLVDCAIIYIYIYIFNIWCDNPQWVMASSLTRFLDHTHWRPTVGRTPLNEWSARRRDLYLTTHNTYNRRISMPPVGFEPTISAGERS